MADWNDMPPLVDSYPPGGDGGRVIPGVGEGAFPSINAQFPSLGGGAGGGAAAAAAGAWGGGGGAWGQSASPCVYIQLSRRRLT